MNFNDENDLDFIDEIERNINIDYDDLTNQMIKWADDKVRREEENYRLKLQTSMFSHNQIRDEVAKKLFKLFRLKFVQTEKTLITGRIDILGIDSSGNYVGIEIKKKALKHEYEQFIKYQNELNELYGPNSKLIVLSSCYNQGLLKFDYSKFELWRYEIWWKYKKGKKSSKYIIDDIRVCMYDKETSTKRLFNDKIIRLK